MPHLRLLYTLLCNLLLWFILESSFHGSRRCIVVDFERPATVSITRQSSDGAEMISGYVQVRKGAHLFWSYYKSPHRVSLSSSPGEPWPTVFYAAPAAASSGHGNLNGIGVLEPRNSTWLHNADLLVVDTPVGTGNSYEEEEEDASANRVRRSLPPVFPQAAADILVLLRALTGEIATLQSSPLILLHSTYGGTYAGRISIVVGQAISAGALNNLTIGGLVERRFDGRTTPQQHQIIDPRPHICVADPANHIRAEHNCTTLRYLVCM